MVDHTIRPQMNEAAIQVAATVIGTWVDCHRSTDFRHTLALVDVTVQAEQWLHLFDDLTYCRAAGWNLVGPPPLHHVVKFLVDLERRVEAALVGRYVNVESPPFGFLEPADQALQASLDLVLVQLAGRLPLRTVEVTEGNHLVE